MERIIELLRSGPPIMADKTLTDGGLYMILIVVIGTAAVLFLTSRIEKNWWKHYLALIVGVFIFEVFTSPMWTNNHFGQYGYAYQDVSWVLTLGWATLMLGTVMLVDYIWGKLHAWKRFFMYLLGMSALGFFGEVMVRNFGLRTYSPEIEQALSGHVWLGTPLDTLYYVPVFSALVIGLYKYWTLIIDGRAVVPIRGGWLRKLMLTLVAVLLFEFMIEPMVINTNFPEWSYFFRDMTWILTLGWTALVWFAVFVVESLWPNVNLKEKFYMYVSMIGIMALPFETYLINAGYRVYEGTSAGNAFSGVVVPFLNTPMEVFLAIPMYFSLVLGFIAYFDAMLVNPLYARYTLRKK